MVWLGWWRAKLHKIIRTTLGEYLAKSAYEGPGVYVLACFPSLGVLYVGISNNVLLRLRQHLADDKPLGSFLRLLMADACGFRLDIHCIEEREAQIDAERRLIRHFRPTFNEQGLGS